MHEAVAKIVLLHICIVITGGFSIWCQKRWNSYPEIHLEKSEGKLLFFILCIVDHWTRSRKFTLVWTNLENLVERKKEKERKGADYFVIVRCFRWCRQHSYIWKFLYTWKTFHHSEASAYIWQEVSSSHVSLYFLRVRRKWCFLYTSSSGVVQPGVTSVLSHS